jgi:23S rRNA (adenine-N6)-dimethyltransferase
MEEKILLKYSQNFLKSKNLVVKILELSSIGPQDLVLEIGPGKGIITEELARRAREVVAIEKDKGLFLFLKEKFKNNPKIKILNIDFLKFQLPKSPYKIFSNIPFFITGEIIKKITFVKSGEKNFLEEAYLIVQKEAAKKFVGQPYAKRNQMVSLFLKPWFELRVIYHFKKTDFYPIPKVNVVLMKIKKRDNPLIEEKQAQIYRDFIVYGFTHFKSNLKNTFKKIFTYEQFKRLSYNLKLENSLLPTDLTFEQWLGLFECFLTRVNESKKSLVIGTENRLKRQQNHLRKIHRTRT